MKSEIRKKVLGLRKAMKKEEVNSLSAVMQNKFLESDIYKNAKCMMLYMPLGNEADTLKIINSAFKDGKKIVLPVTNQESGIITPCYADENTEFITGGFSVSEPKNAEIADFSDIELVVVPGVAFDKKGKRIGFGKGCYDRFLNNTKATKVGFCYSFQLVDEIPSEMHDVSMDYIISENGIIEV